MIHLKDIACIMVIFGGTGDLTHRKLIPAIYNLSCEGLLCDNFAIVGTGRKSKSHAQYRDELLSSIGKFSRIKAHDDIWCKISSRIFYYQLNFPDASAYLGLKEFLEDMDEQIHTGGNRLYYLSVSPCFFETVALNLKANAMAENKGCWQRLMVEKPFGNNLKTAQYLNASIMGVFPEQNIFRIDHYLGKEMLQNMLVLRFGNAMFESIWNSRYIDNIQITSSETIGVENRAEYYEASGAMRDMVQNHMLQLLALVAMEPPSTLDAKSIREEKVKLLRSLGKIGPGNIHANIVRGQYGRSTDDNGALPAYREEKGVSEYSDTETFVAMRLFVGNFRWGNMPFYFRTGKRVAKKATSIIIEFKAAPEILYFKEYKGMLPNLLEIRIEPEEGISLQFNTKKPGTVNEITTVKMNFCQTCMFEGNSPEAYERLISDALKDDHSLFTSWEEIETAWSFVDSILAEWKSETDPGFPNYAAGSWGPGEALQLLEKDGHQWWNLHDSV